MQDHHIDGTHLCSKRHAKLSFRKRILDNWDFTCAYCGAEAHTLDHVHPRSKGGFTSAENMVACCADCNRDKGSENWIIWFRSKEFWTPEREADIWIWINFKDKRPLELLSIHM